MAKVSGKVCLVTGGALGVGAAIAAELVKEGAKHVIFLDILQDEGVETEKEISDKYGKDKVTFIMCDVTDDTELASVYKRLMDEHKRVDLVVNNAGIYEERKTKFKKMVDVNFSAFVESTMNAIELMSRECGGHGGTIVNVSSIAALIPSHRFPVYGATKSAVNFFGQPMGSEAVYSRTNVRIINVCLGGTSTRLTDAENLGPNGIVKSWDQSVQLELEAISASITKQSPEEAARAIMDVYKKGESASTWTVVDGEANDISAIVGGKGFSQLLSKHAMQLLSKN